MDISQLIVEDLFSLAISGLSSNYLEGSSRERGKNRKTLPSFKLHMIICLKSEVGGLASIFYCLMLPSNWIISQLLDAVAHSGVRY